MPSDGIYNLEPVSAPRLVGFALESFARLLRVPLLGRWIVDGLKRKNGIGRMVDFAANAVYVGADGGGGGREGGGEGGGRRLTPLYHPVHEVDDEEAAAHERMAGEAPLDLEALAATDPAQPSGGGEGSRYHGIGDYTRRYRDGSITPSEVAERLIKIVEEANEREPESRIVTMMDAADLRRQAAESTRRYETGTTKGVLDGVPVLVKDEIPVLGYPMARGTSFVSDPAAEDAVPIKRLREHGALIAGKVNQHEIGIGTTGYNRHFGTPLNPHGKVGGPNYYTGGSSSGSAAAVAQGLVPLAIGTDGGGSVRIPSALCGIVGLKPTFGRIPYDEASCSVTHMGPMATNVEDAALAYAIMAGPSKGSRDQPPPHLYEYVRGRSDSLKGLRVGVFEEHNADADASVRAATDEAIRRCVRLGAEIVPIALPRLQEIKLAHSVIIMTEMRSLMERHYRSGRYVNLSPETRVTLTIGESCSGADFVAALKVRSYATRHIEDLFKNEVDLILSPATPCVAPVFEEAARPQGETNLSETTKLMQYMVHGNLTGVPAIVFPMGRDEETGLPLSLQLMAAHWREDLLLRVAEAWLRIVEGRIEKPRRGYDLLAA